METRFIIDLPDLRQVLLGDVISLARSVERVNLKFGYSPCKIMHEDGGPAARLAFLTKPSDAYIAELHRAVARWERRLKAAGVTEAIKS